MRECRVECDVFSPLIEFYKARLNLVCRKSAIAVTIEASNTHR